MYVRYVRYTPVRIGYVTLPFNSASASASATWGYPLMAELCDVSDRVE
jgi:hypothetical protein